MVSQVAVSPDTYVVDTREMGFEGRTAVYVIDGERPTIVDTGLSTAVPHVLDALDRIGLEPDHVEFIALTHIHMDHAGGVGPLVEACENATVLCHEFGVDFISVPEKVERLVESVHEAVGGLADDYGTMEPVPAARIRPLEGGDRIDLGDRTLDVRHSPGHAPHQVAYVDAGHGCLFPGDECGEYVADNVLPSTPPPNFDAEALRESLDAFEALDPAAVYYPHFGERTDVLDVIDAYRRVLDEWIETVAQASAEHDDAAEIASALLADGHPYRGEYGETVARELLRLNVEGARTYLGW